MELGGNWIVATITGKVAIIPQNPRLSSDNYFGMF